MKSIIVHHHLGIGDHFICNGLVHTICDEYDEVHLICKSACYPTVKHLYEDYEKIKVIPINDEPSDAYRYAAETGIPLVRIGFENLDRSKFEHSFYELVNIPLENRYTRFRFPNNLEKSIAFYEKVIYNKSRDYIFVFNTSTHCTHNLKIESTLPQVVAKKSDTDDIIDYVHTIMNAKEVHFINSGLWPMIVQMYFLKLLHCDKIYFHDVRKLSEGGLKIDIPNGIEIVKYED